MRTGHRAGVAGVVIAALVAGSPRAFAKDGWEVNNALLRFTVTIDERPNRPEAGCIVTLPDGGLLPRPAPAIAVVDDDGHRLASGCLWYDPAQAMALVFACPVRGKRVHVYAARGGRVSPWTPESALKPGTLLYMQAGGGNIGDARRIAAHFPPGKGVYFAQVSDLAIGALPRDLPGSFADYLVGFVISRDPGKTWFAFEPSGKGEMDLYVDGKKLTPEKTFPQLSGATGDWVTLTNRPARVELYAHRPDKSARLRVAWRTPHAGHAELGGDSPKYKGQPMWAARPLREDECLRSGTASVTAIERRDEGLIAAYTMTAESYVWFPPDDPVILYRFRARAGDNPKRAQYAWDFAPKQRVANAVECDWLLKAYQDYGIRLTVSAANQETAAGYEFHSFCRGELGANLNHGGTCRMYREALLGMARALPDDADLTAAWNPAVWGVCMHLLDPAESQALVEEFFKGRRWDATARKLPDARRWPIEDIFFASLCPKAPAKAAEWLARFEHAERNSARQEQWRLRRIDLCLYYLDDIAQARKLAAVLASGKSDVAKTAYIRLGDIALAEGNYDEAVRIYGNAEAGVSHADALPPELPPSKLARRIERHGRLPLRRALPDAGDVEDWRIGVIRDTAVSETAHSQLKGRDYIGARRTLDQWEREFPLSRLTGDYAVVEAAYYMGLGDYVRPAHALAAYCKAVDVTPYLPDAVKLALQCMVETNTPDDKLRAFADEMKRRFKYHPVGAEIDPTLARLKAEKGR